jgi:LysM repeat protein
MTKARIVHPRMATSVCVLALSLTAGAALAQSATSRYPITPEQRQLADQVASAGVPLSALAANAPDTYTVKSGDTLWDISSVFLTSPWRWPELWGMNKDQVRNPHLIYPGQTLALVKGADGRARLQVADGRGGAMQTALPGAPGDVVRMSPRVRLAGTDGGAAISSIPNNVIEPYLSQPMIVALADLEKYPRIVATQEGRVYLGRGDIAYARGIGDDRVENYHVFRPARPLYDPDDTARKAPIAYEAFFLGTARLTKRGEVATLQIQDAKEEIGVQDRLVPIERKPLVQYVPRAPERAVDGRIVSVYSGVDQAGSLSVVTLNRGKRDGLEVGHVLALLETGATVQDRTTSKREFIKLPDERIGEMFVFRVFDGISYALIMRVQKPVKVGDRFTQPDGIAIVAAAPAGVEPQALPSAR